MAQNKTTVGNHEFNNLSLKIDPSIHVAGVHLNPSHLLRKSANLNLENREI